MKLYKKFENDNKYKAYHKLAKEYLEFNNIKCKYYGWIGMSKDLDIVKTDKGIMYFDINTKEYIKTII